MVIVEYQQPYSLGGQAALVRSFNLPASDDLKKFFVEP
jgi:hypothetical protein